MRRATLRIDDAIESDLDAMRLIALHAIREVRGVVTSSTDAVFHFAP